MNSPLISIVTGTYNRLPLLTRLIKSARTQLLPGLSYEFVICDGGSTDGTIEWLRQQSDVTLLEHGELRGAIAAFTDAAHLARGKYVVLANDDVTFMPNSIYAALAHLENTPTCGAVAFADNRMKPKGVYDVFDVPAKFADGSRTAANYAQVGMFRRWLGEKVNWWRGFDPRFANARTYGGDNMLSANIWELGYSVDKVDSACVQDFMHEDGMRTINSSNGEADAKAYYSVFPEGPTLPGQPMVDNPDERQLRVLYLPVYEPGWAIQKAQKCGLRDALAKRFIVAEVDYVGYASEYGRGALHAYLKELIRVFKPDLMLSQLHGADIISADDLMTIRGIHPRMVCVNWNGDYWPHGLTTPDVMKLLRYVDLQLTVNASVISEYENAQIPAAYWQIGYEEPGDDLPTGTPFDVVWLASKYLNREKMYQFLTTLPYTVGIYGRGWPASLGDTTYNFQLGKAIYRAAKIAIGDNQFQDAYGFVSNRIFQALAAGGALLFHQTVPGLEELTGLKAGVHYIQWRDFADLETKLMFWLDPVNEERRLKIANAGTKYVLKNHSFDKRVEQLVNELLPLARKRPRLFVELEFVGQRKVQFGVMGKATKRHYVFEPNKAFIVDALDWPYIEREMPGLWREVQSGR